jgi:hypothetical protein
MLLPFPSPLHTDRNDERTSRAALLISAVFELDKFEARQYSRPQSLGILYIADDDTIHTVIIKRGSSVPN